MRTKKEILSESKKHELKTPIWDSEASVNERLTIEVLVDIRDFLDRITSSLMAIERRQVK